MSERIVAEVRRLGLGDDAMVVGSGALEGLGIRTATDIDLAVTPEVYRVLRETAGWQERQGYGGSALLAHQSEATGLLTEVGIDWGSYGTEQLRANAYALDGVRFAGLPEVYAWKQATGRAQDVPDLTGIQSRLFNTLLPGVALRREQEYVQSLLPEHLQEHPAVRVAAQGLYTVRTLYGDPADGSVRCYSGAVEQNVHAFYHCYPHTAEGLPRVVRQARLANQARQRSELPLQYDDDDVLSSIAAFSWHDVVMGHGRQSANPKSYDELQSAWIVARQLGRAGAAAERLAEKAYVGVRATAFNESTATQAVDVAAGHAPVQVAVAGTDLGLMTEPHALDGMVANTLENMDRVGAGMLRPLGASLDVRVSGSPPVVSVETALAHIDSEPLLVDYLITGLKNSAEFYSRYQYPKGWMLDDAAKRRQHALRAKMLAEALRIQHIRPSDLPAISEQYAQV